jgi:UDP-N-acetyl-D-galactosamine dehydrogenase
MLDNMGRFYAKEVVRLISKSKKDLKNLKLLILGATFKENCSDARNSRVFDIAEELKSYGIKSNIFDPYINKDKLNEIDARYHSSFKFSFTGLKDYDVILLAVKHNKFCDLSKKDVNRLIRNKDSIIYDIKNTQTKAINFCKYYTI